jgi:hypothetical protein
MVDHTQVIVNWEANSVPSSRFAGGWPDPPKYPAKKNLGAKTASPRRFAVPEYWTAWIGEGPECFAKCVKVAQVVDDKEPGMADGQAILVKIF